MEALLYDVHGNLPALEAVLADAVTHPIAQGAIESAREALGERLVEDLAALPSSARKGETLICHASPASDIRSFYPEPADDEAELLEGVEARMLIFGHTHLPFFREAANGIELMNPGERSRHDA